jgi:hypothetical protein
VSVSRSVGVSHFLWFRVFTGRVSKSSFWSGLVRDEVLQAVERVRREVSREANGVDLDSNDRSK